MRRDAFIKSIAALAAALPARLLRPSPARGEPVEPPRALRLGCASLRTSGVLSRQAAALRCAGSARAPPRARGA